VGEDLEARMNTILREILHLQTAKFGILWPPHSAVGHCMHQRHVAIDAYQDEEVEAAIDVHLNAQVDDFAKELTEGPVEAVGYVDSPERQTRHQQQVGSSQVAQVDLRHSAGLLVETEHHQDEHVKKYSQHRDEQDIDRLTGVKPLPVVQLRTFSAICAVLVPI
uniref:Uncharacterized protein n=1 Tax=Echeneis naucrates TaxID=173247 RepID=A0A665WBJ0_ECHNA